MSNLPFELLCCNYNGRELRYWYYPVANILEIFIGNKLQDKVLLDKNIRYLHKWIDDEKFGRMQV